MASNPPDRQTIQPSVDIALALPTEQDGDELAKLYDLGDLLLTRNLMPDKQLDVVEQIILKNWMIARTADARLAWAMEYCREFQLWRHRKILRDGKQEQEFATFGDWQRYIYSQCSGLSKRSIDMRLAGVRIVKSLEIGVEEGVELLADPSGIHQVARLFEQDGLSRFTGFVSKDVEDRAREYIGADEDEPPEEVARDLVRAMLTTEDSVSRKVDELLHAGEVRHKFVYDPPYLKLEVWRVGGGYRKVVRFKRVDPVDDDKEVERTLSRYRK
jgi:hypothetical protein